MREADAPSESIPIYLGFFWYYRVLKNLILPLVFLCYTLGAAAQADSLRYTHSLHPSVPGLIAPTILIGYGFAALKWQALKDFDNNVRQKVWVDHPHGTTNIDQYLQFAPAAAVYVLNAAGVKGWHDFRDRTVIYVLANAFMGVSAYSIKKTVNSPRPDGSDNSGLPSGHAAVAFLAAEFLRQEFRDKSVWYGIAGYTVAAGTSYLRLYNDQHWFSQLATGAGIGILAAQASYWIFPWVERKFLPARHHKIELD